MSNTILVEGKVIGKRSPLFSDWRVALPTKDKQAPNILGLRDLISGAVKDEVRAFRQRQEDRRLARILSTEEIILAAQAGKVNPGVTTVFHPES